MKLGSGTAGAEGRVAFAYSGWSCLFGCELDRPMLVGTEETISMNGDGTDATGVTVTSSAPSIARATITRSCVCEQRSAEGSSATTAQDGEPCPTGYARSCTNDIQVDALRAGSAELTVHDPEGALLDRTTVNVATAARVTLLDPDSRKAITAPLSVAVGADFNLDAKAFDAAGTELMSSRGIEWSTTGAVSVEPFCFFCESGVGAFQADRVGPGTVTATAAGATASAGVRVHE